MLKQRKKKKRTCDSNSTIWSRFKSNPSALSIQLGSGGSLNRHDTVKYLCDLGLVSFATTAV